MTEQYRKSEELRNGKIEKSSNLICKNSKTFKKKHVRHALELEKKRMLGIIHSTVNGWLELGQSVSLAELKDYLKCIKRLLKLMGYRYKKHLVWATIIYLDKFVKKAGPVDVTQIFNLLHTSAFISIKFWEDTGIDEDLAAYVIGITKKEIGSLERTFLQQIDYSLNLTCSDIESFENYSNMTSFTVPAC